MELLAETALSVEGGLPIGQILGLGLMIGVLGLAALAIYVVFVRW